MTAWAVIPMKSPQIGKSRLADTLAREQRSALSLQMFLNVLNAVIPVFGEQRVVVVSEDPEILSMTCRMRLHAVREARPGDLNAALHQGAEYARCRGASGVLLVFGDLPCVNAKDIQGMVDAAEGEHCIVASPDRAGTGTNALFASPPDAIAFKFGLNSFHRHRREALSRRCKWSVFRCDGLAFDVDRPEDVGALGDVITVPGRPMASEAVA